MFGIFKSEERIRTDYINHMNDFYRSKGYKATVLNNDNDVFTVEWDAHFIATSNGVDPLDFEYELTYNNDSVFPNSEEDKILKNILLDRYFKYYELCYKTSSGNIIRAHKTRL